MTLYRRFGKALFDRAAAAAGMVMLAPVIGVAAALIRVKLGRPIIFSQTRPGHSGSPFTIYKFRTMTDKRDADGNLLPDAQRLAPFGRWLRSSSLDELPELWNVLKGEMSLVGPRPLLMQYLELYDDHQARRHEVRPGITGWAQVNGRNTASWPERLAMDVWYVDNVSLRLDLKILYMTLLNVVRREGISQEGHATVEYFAGNNP